MRLMIAAAIVALGITAAEETKLGAGVTLKDATPIKAVIERPDEFVGKTIRVDGVATGSASTWDAGWRSVTSPTRTAQPFGSRSTMVDAIVFPGDRQG